ncbi:integrase catalytic domain-containing protein [Trichonephila clavata]|uniref:Integrase catalytic domain-containing protein n=1 Tax=Trichonephila clavata TaxID=2740835 RepID=A0A8X6LBD2_TRICU|nr:integrase catalytic domain-containing protein [Trichonephila clavata]
MGSMSTDLADQNIGEVSLQTLTVYIKNGNSKQLVRAIFYTGSQKSYISEYATQFIGLKSVEKETITHVLFRGHKITEFDDKYLINLCSYDGKYSFKMEVNDQKNICLGISRFNDSRVLQKLATLNIFISDLSANNKLCLFEKHSDEIHILLGSDIVGKLFTGEGAATPSTQPCSSVSNGGARLEPRAETNGHQQAETSSMQPCPSVPDDAAGVEPRVETLELPDDLTSDFRLQQPGPRRSLYGRLLKLRKRLNDSC